MTRKRSAYRPRHSANPLAFMTAIQGAHKLCADDQLIRPQPPHHLRLASTGANQWRLTPVMFAVLLGAERRM